MFQVLFKSPLTSHACEIYPNEIENTSYENLLSLLVASDSIFSTPVKLLKAYTHYGLIFLPLHAQYIQHNPDIVTHLWYSALSI